MQDYWEIVEGGGGVFLVRDYEKFIEKYPVGKIPLNW